MNLEHRAHTFEDVNPLIRAAFGKRFAGNFLNANSQCGLIETDQLEVIGDRGASLFGLTVFGQKAIGIFESRDGSVLKVIPEYASSAVVYAEMYESKFKKQVSIIIDSSANRLDYVHPFA